MLFLIEGIGFIFIIFEPSVFHSVLDFNKISEYYNDLQLAVCIVEELNLNTHIWTKE